MKKMIEKDTKGQEWFEISISHSTGLKESIGNRLFELGAQGIVEEPNILKAYFLAENRAAVEKEIKHFIQSLEGVLTDEKAAFETSSEVVKKNWAEHHRSFYPAQKLSRLFYLQPFWDEKVEIPSGMIPIVMEPGQAFGTGLHASTRLCLSLFEKTIELFAKPAELSLIDVGTGTGILAIAARKAGIKNVVAMDNDPLAVEVAQENFERNGCLDIESFAGDLSSVEKKFDIILANILLETHRELMGAYRRLLKPGGYLILSGLLNEQREEIELIVKGAGLNREMLEVSQEWLGVSYSGF
jgi:ribosomal protein L11 methyltransferase